MSRNATTHPTDVELEILQILWNHGPVTLGQVCAALQKERKVAKTTVATMLSVMRSKKLVERSKKASIPVWSARISRDDAAGSILSKLLDRIFDGSAGRLMAHLVETGEFSDKERKELGRLLAAHGSPRPGQSGKTAGGKSSTRERG